jgi:hypothetical protein
MASLTTGGSTTTGTFTSSEATVNLELGVSRILAVSATSANVALTSTCRFVSLVTTAGTHVHISVGVGAQTATTSSHILLVNQRITIAVPFGANIAALQGSLSGNLYISELTQ